jgi:hypothetical protein
MNAARLIDLVKRNGEDLIILFVIPIFIALLPWSIGFRLLRKMARHERSHSANVNQAWEMAKAHFPDENEEDWKWRYRLLRLVERVDAWLVLIRPRRWWSKRIVQNGEFPKADGPHVFLSYHWGGGQWIWSQLVQYGFPTHLISRRAGTADLGAGRLSLLLGRARLRGIRRLGGLEVIFLGGAKGPVRDALAQGHHLLGMQDMPAGAWETALRRPVLDGEVAFPFGLARLAIEANASIVLLSFAFDVSTGVRTLNVKPLPRDADIETVATHYVRHLDECLREESAFWQIWSLAPLLFVQRESPLPS